MITTHDKIHFTEWHDVDNYINCGKLKFSAGYVERVKYGNYPELAFSKGQMASKNWLIEQLFSLNQSHSLINNKDIIAILGCWIGSLVEPLIDTFSPYRIYGIDIDPEAIALAEKFNQHYVGNGWKFKGFVDDINELPSNNMQIQSEGELIEVKPNVIINTSCEHVSNHWFDTADSDQLIIMQTNNYTEWHDHINNCYSIDEMQQKYPLTRTLYAGELLMPVYTRYMQIGFK